jgi:hypothetical protein
MYIELIRASEVTLSRWSRLHLQSPTNPHWARVVGYGPFSLCVIHKKGLSSGDISDATTTPTFYQNYLAMKTTTEWTGGKLIAV